jgi:hypothetical protein
MEWQEKFIPEKQVKLLWHSGEVTPNFYSNPNAVTTSLWWKMPLPIITYYILPLLPNCCAPNGGQWLLWPHTRRLWISLSPSSDNKIIKNPINTRRVKTKTNLIKLTITYIHTYIQSIYTHNLQLHTIQ